MRRDHRKLGRGLSALTALVLGASPSEATLLSDPAHPALQGALVSGFEGVPTTTSAFSLGLGSVVVTVEAVRPGYGLVSCFLDDCRITSWGEDDRRIQFSPPVAAVAIDALAYTCGLDYEVTIVGASGTETRRVSQGAAPSEMVGAADIGPISAMVLGTGDCAYAAAFDNLRVVPYPSTVAADVSVNKAASRRVAGPEEPLDYTLLAANQGPDAAAALEVVDFLPFGAVHLQSTPPAATAPGDRRATWSFGDVGPGSLGGMNLAIQTPPMSRFGCADTLVNVAVARSSTPDPDAASNLAVDVVSFDPQAARPEVCDNRIDDDCDGRIDCADREDCPCLPQLPPRDEPPPGRRPARAA
jgi:uncharacterized repeat protein (TIGR01451 family)